VNSIAASSCVLTSIQHPNQLVKGISRRTIDTSLVVIAHPGWPQETNDEVRSAPVLGDLEDDGDLEIIVGTNDGRVYAWHHDGTLIRCLSININMLQIVTIAAHKSL